MTSISVEGIRGGIGTSTLTWAIARELENYSLFDYSEHQGLGWITGGIELDLSWPKYVSPEVEITELISNMKLVEQIPVFSGGSCHKWEADKLINFQGNLLIDGKFDSQIRILLTTNSFADIKVLESGVDFDAVVMRKIRGGVPIAIVPDLPIDFLYKSETNVHRTVSNGYGLHRKTAVQKVAKEICARFFSASTKNNQ